MAYDTKSILNGERVYEVLREISQADEGSYSSKIAEELDIKQQSASEIINRLNDNNLLQKGKRTRAQYYEINIDGFIDIFQKYVDEEILQDREVEKEDILDDLDNRKEMYDEEKDYSIDQALERDFPVFFKFYIGYYLDSVQESTIKKMVFNDFLEGILTYDTGPKELPGWYDVIKDIGKMKYGFFEDPSSLVGAALIEYEKLPDTIEKLEEEVDED